MSRRKFFIALIFVIVAGFFIYGFFLVRSTNRITTINSSFVERRNNVAALLQQLSSVPDVDLSRLADIDRRRAWGEGLQFMTDVVGEHARVVAMVESLVTSTRDLIVETQRTTDQTLREQALAAMVHLGSGNDHMLSYFRLRSRLFRSFQQYYADRALGKSSRAPDVTADFTLIDEAIYKANESYALFRILIERFDRVAGLRAQGALLFLS